MLPLAAAAGPILGAVGRGAAGEAGKEIFSKLTGGDDKPQQAPAAGSDPFQNQEKGTSITY